MLWCEKVRHNVKKKIIMTSKRTEVMSSCQKNMYLLEIRHDRKKPHDVKTDSYI